MSDVQVSCNMISLHMLNKNPKNRSDDEESDYEISDQDVNKLLIVTQSPPSVIGGTSNRPAKHDGFDRTGDWTTRVKITQELAKVINDGLYNYEQDLWDGNEWVRLIYLIVMSYSFVCKELEW